MANTRKPRPTSSRRRSSQRDTTTRTWAIGAGLLGAAAVGLAALLRGRIAALFEPRDGHPVPDLAADAPPPGTTRAVEHFRPDPTAVPSAEEREALRPATGPAPSLAADRGEMANQTSPGSAREDIAVASEPAT